MLPSKSNQFTYDQKRWIPKVLLALASTGPDFPMLDPALLHSQDAPDISYVFGHQGGKDEEEGIPSLQEGLNTHIFPIQTHSHCPSQLFPHHKRSSAWDHRRRWSSRHPY